MQNNLPLVVHVKLLITGEFPYKIRGVKLAAYGGPRCLEYLSTSTTLTTVLPAFHRKNLLYLGVKLTLNTVGIYIIPNNPSRSLG